MSQDEDTRQAQLQHANELQEERRRKLEGRDTIHNKLPLYLQIPIPIPSPRPRGIYSLGALSIPYSVRIDEPTLTRIRVRANQLDISAAEFIRWCATQMIERIDEHIGKAIETESES